MPSLSAVLVEPRRKRVAFQRTAIGSLGLEARARVVEARFEGTAPDGAPFDLAISRATFAPDDWLRRARSLSPVVAVLGVDALPDPDAHRARVLADVVYRLPFADRPRRLGVYRYL
ncbi:MAG: hypothetical protein AB7P00_42735 [Sandaracinaceae bacterium]